MKSNRGAENERPQSSHKSSQHECHRKRWSRRAVRSWSRWTGKAEIALDTVRQCCSAWQREMKHPPRELLIVPLPAEHQTAALEESEGSAEHPAIHLCQAHAEQASLHTGSIWSSSKIQLKCNGLGSNHLFLCCRLQKASKHIQVLNVNAGVLNSSKNKCVL